MAGDRGSNREAGFTLIEVLLVTVVVGIIMGGITAGIIVGVNTVHVSSNRLNGSGDRQLLNYYLQRDATSAVDAYANVTTSSSPRSCFSTGSSAQVALMLTWSVISTSGSPPTTTVVPDEVDYVLSASTVAGSGANATQELVRYLYSGSYAASSCTLVSQTTVAYAVETAAQGTANGTTPLSVSTPTLGTAGLVSVTLTDASGTYTVSGQERS